MEIVIDGKKISVQAGQTILEAALANQIFIPHLCGSKHLGGCRLCLVQAGSQITAACTQKVAPGLVVQTRTPQIDQLVSLAWELLLASHQMYCSECNQNHNCQLKQIARLRSLPLPARTFPALEKEIINFPNGLIWQKSQCLFCSKCIEQCQQKGSGILGWIGKGSQRRLALEDRLDSCRNCQRCPGFCGALKKLKF